MRPSLLDPLFSPITALEGIGPKVADMIAKVVPADATDRAVLVTSSALLGAATAPASLARPKARSSRSICASIVTSHRRAATRTFPTGCLRMTTPAKSR